MPNSFLSAGGTAIENLFDLGNRVALITGGTGVLGTVFAETLASQGADIVLLDVDESKCALRAREIAESTGRRVLGIAADVASEDDVKNSVNLAEKTLGRIDILVNNAAAQPAGMFAQMEDYPLEVWNRVMAVNLTGHFLMSRAVGPLMVRNGRGSIINISSIYGVVAPDQRIYDGLGFNTPPAYAASKAGVLGLTRYLATYWSNKGIRVNALTPGGVFRDHQEPFLTRYSSRVPLGRMADQKELRGAILYLASDASSYVTGQNLIVDGGLTTW